jgi:hypothetical protein
VDLHGRRVWGVPEGLLLTETREWHILYIHIEEEGVTAPCSQKALI